MSSLLRNGFTKKLIFLLKPEQDPEDAEFTMVLADPKIYQELGEGYHIEQSNSKNYHPDVAFENKEVVKIVMENIRETIQVECKEEGGRFIIPYQEYKRIKNQFGDESDSSAEQGLSEGSEEENSDTSEEQFDNELPIQEARKRGRPKGSKNKKKFMLQDQEDSFQDQDQFNQDHKRGRGRPKGSKNKRPGMKKEDDKDDLRVLMSGYLKRGKGRPIGSKNKPKKKEQLILPGPGAEGNSNFWKRGKGRPRGSKNKIKNIYIDKQLASIFQQPKEKRNRGRPKGVKNKPRSDPSVEQSSDNQDIGELPELPAFVGDQPCCEKCQVRVFKRRLINAESVEEAKEVMEELEVSNISEDFELELKTNLFVTAFKRNNPHFLELLLDNCDRTTEFFKSCWDVNGKFQQDKYTVRTKKEFLSRSGKEGVYGLLHDYYPKLKPWWKNLGVQRIIESLPEDCNKQMISTLRMHSEQLYQQMYSNVAVAIRGGNCQVASLILECPPTIQQEYYTRQHLEFLKNQPQFQYKKANILRRNQFPNYCSPIHCASINLNVQILERIIISTLDYNIGDSFNRKPIHYAAAAQCVVNLEVLCRYGADVRDLDKSKMTPLMIASYYGRTQNVSFILSKCNEQLYVNHRSQEGYSAIHYAILRGHTETVRVLLDEPSVQANCQTRDKQTSYHLAASIGNPQILSLVIAKSLYIDSIDKFKRSPLMMSIRNHTHDSFRTLIRQQSKLLKTDSSGNTLLHYSAAYGNTYATKYLSKLIKQTENKTGFTPWQIAVAKGHLGCANYLENNLRTSNNHSRIVKLDYLMIKHAQGSKQGLKVLRYMLDGYCSDYIEELDNNDNTLLHVLCSSSEDDYIKQRIRQNGNLRAIKKQFKDMFQQLIPVLLAKGLNKERVNKNHETALGLALESNNLVAMKLLLPVQVDLQYETTMGVTMLGCLSNLASQGAEQTKLVHQRLAKQDKGTLLQLFKSAHNGCDPILLFVKNFTSTVVTNYKQEIDVAAGVPSMDIRKRAFKKLQEHQGAFVKLMTFFYKAGIAFNSICLSGADQGWGIVHYLMKFPSIKLLDYFKPILKNFNLVTRTGLTPLHIFCQLNKKTNLVDPHFDNDYNGESSLKYLLQHGCNPKILDCQDSSAIHYAAYNRETRFIEILISHGCQINSCNKKNKVPFIQLIKQNELLTIEQLRTFLALGADPNFSDLNKRTALHHLVSISQNFDSSPRLCNLLHSFGAQINSLDEFQRTPLFYCFIQIDRPGTHFRSDENQNINDKLEIVQMLINFEKIDLNHVDICGRTAVHYACEKNFFFSILYLLDKNIDISIQDNQGNTPLAVCLISRNLNQAALLLKKGIFLGYVNQGGKRMTYFSYALKNSLVQICYLLLDYGYPLEEALKEANDNQALTKIIKQKGQAKAMDVADLHS